MDEYSGRIRLSMLISSEESLAQYRIKSIDISKDWFIRNTAENYYYYDFVEDYNSVIFICACQQDTKEEILVDWEYITDSRLRIKSITNDPITIYFICRGEETGDSSGEQTIFYPQTKSNMVIFNDNMSLEDMYINNLLYRNNHEDEAGKWRYCKAITPDTFIENRGTYVIEIPPDEHNLSDSVVVTDLLCTTTDGYTTDVKNNATIRIAEDGTVRIIIGTTFTGSVIIEKKGWR